MYKALLFWQGINQIGLDDESAVGFMLFIPFMLLIFGHAFGSLFSGRSDDKLGGIGLFMGIAIMLILMFA